MRELRPTPDWLKLLPDYKNRLEEIITLSLPEANNTERYLHWETLKYKAHPKGLNSEEWWTGIKFHRNASRQIIPLLDKKGLPFTFTNNALLLESLHKIDLLCGGRIQGNSPIFSQMDKDRYYYSSLVEESITSSQLEGAAVTRAVAKEMIRLKRAPLDKDERMILNNYKTMQEIGKWKDEPLSLSLILRIHKLITQGTLESSKQEGKLREEKDNVRVEDETSGEIIHIPPAAHLLPERLQQLCDFANETESTTGYIHPVIRSIILHFWIAYDHPFVDGNGRTARALFYWSMIKHHFWLFEYISISREILNHPKNYYRSFLYTEFDSNDLNYFLTNQLQTINSSIFTLQNHITKKTEEHIKIQNLIKNRTDINHRQTLLLLDALKHPERIYTVASHREESKISIQTSRTDLQGLVKLKLFSQSQKGKAIAYEPLFDLEKKLKVDR